MFQHKKPSVFVSPFWKQRHCRFPVSKVSMRLWRCFRWPQAVCLELPLADCLVSLSVNWRRSVPRVPPAPGRLVLAQRPSVGESSLLPLLLERREDPRGRAAFMTSRSDDGVPPPGPLELVEGVELVWRWLEDLWSGRRSGEWRPVGTMVREAAVSGTVIRGMVVSGTGVSGTVVGGMVVSGTVVLGMMVKGMVIRGLAVSGTMISWMMVRGAAVGRAVVRRMVVSGVVIRRTLIFWRVVAETMDCVR